MNFVLGAIIGLCLGILCGRALSPKTSWLAFSALIVVMAFGVWFTTQATPEVQSAGIVAALALVLTTQFAGAYYLKLEEGMEDLSYGGRLRVWMSPKLRRAIQNSIDINAELSAGDR